uniref:EF-hand domain-containing protein n=1 Tax=Tetradesmus obliquus TaxID=3088 RepID=A0A383WDY0_TETOB|eukprot:jgi/Sobl393_1/5785/SZX75329.1
MRFFLQDDKPGKPKNKQEEYIEALKKGGVDQKTAKTILERWKETGADTDPSQLRKLFLKQSLVPITASLIQLLFDAGAAYSLFMTAGFFALGPPFFGRTVLVLAGDFLAIYFAICLLFDIVTLTSVLISTARLGTTPVAFFDAVKTIAAPAGSSTAADGLKIVEKAKAAVSAVKAGFDPSSVGMSEAEAANIALVFGQYDLDDNGRLDSNEFVKMLGTLGADVSTSEAEAAMEIMDANKDGFITFDEFATWWAARKKGK